MTNYNHAKYLPFSIQTILDQSRQPDEIIVIDDASTDNSVQIIREYQKQHANFKLLQNESNMGILHNINRLLNIASSKYVCFFSADDIVLPGLLEKSLLLLQKYPEAAICSSQSAQIDGKGETLRILATPMPLRIPGYMTPDDVKNKLCKTGPWFMGNTTVYKRESLLSIGGFNEQLYSFCDGFASTLISLNEGACFIPQPLAAWRQMDGGFASHNQASGDRSMMVTKNALDLMRNKYSHIFPEKYANKWERGRQAAWHIVQAEHDYNNNMKDLQRYRRSSIKIVRIFTPFFSGVLKIILIFKKIFLMVRYRQPIVRIALRKLFS